MYRVMGLTVGQRPFLLLNLFFAKKIRNLSGLQVSDVNLQSA